MQKEYKRPKKEHKSSKQVPPLELKVSPSEQMVRQHCEI